MFWNGNTAIDGLSGSGSDFVASGTIEVDASATVVSASFDLAAYMRMGRSMF